MTVIEGEGRVPILYGNQAMPVAPHRSMYVARPDLAGRHPGLVIAQPDPVPRPAVHDLARRIARYGYVAAAPAGDARAVRHAIDALTVGWTDFVRSGPLAVLTVEEAAVWAAPVAAAEEDAHVVALAPPVDAALAVAPRPLLVLTAGDGAAAQQESVGHGTWVIYKQRNVGFWDVDSEEYSRPAAEDAFERMIGFLDRHLGAAVAV